RNRPSANGLLWMQQDLARPLDDDQAFRFKVRHQIGDIPHAGFLVHLVFPGQRAAYLANRRRRIAELEQAQADAIETVTDAARRAQRHGFAVYLRKYEVRTVADDTRGFDNGRGEAGSHHQVTSARI
ncbi:MAG TPA: hypothetical protein VGN38_12530, partial [Caulobacteraceae bacterium]|nr:hypothetical protein [Caulobacteraceae bacterium]